MKADQKSSGPVLVIGDIVEDVVVHLTGPIRPATDTPSRIMRRRGGSAANVAVAAAEAGAAVRFIGCVGPDTAGEFVVSDLRQYGVDVTELAGSRTGSIIILVDPTGERTMLPDRGASGEYDHIPRNLLADARVLHLTSYSLVAEPTRTACVEAAQAVHAHGGFVTIDASSAGIIADVTPAALLKTWAQIRPDIVFANEDEALALDLAAKPGELAQTVIVIKHGARPTELWVPGQAAFYVEVPPVTGIIDLTGAGDAFAGGFLAHLGDCHDGEQLRVCTAAAHARAALAITRVGA
ncbi:MAG: carbohydrate kinase family protein [Propionibacteriaceae bacterium]